MYLCPWNKKTLIIMKKLDTSDILGSRHPIYQKILLRKNNRF